MPKKSVHSSGSSNDASRRETSSTRRPPPPSVLGDLKILAYVVGLGIIYLIFSTMNFLPQNRPPLDNRIAFVTGSTGATGRSIVAQLANKDWTVYALTRKSTDDKLELFPELSSNNLDKVQIVFEPDPESWSRQVPLPLPEKLDAVFLCHGTSREYADVQTDIAGNGQEGFAKWLQRVDVDITSRVAFAAIENRVRVIARISASHADPDHDPEALGGFGLYFKYQGIADQALIEMQKEEMKSADASRILIFRPGSLDRGEEKRATRPWEQEIARKGERKTMPVGLLASAIIRQAEVNLLWDNVVAAGSNKIFSYDEMWSIVNDLEL